MFIKKLSIYSFLIAAAFCAVSCDDDVDYTPAEVPNTDQVYFPNTARRSVVLEENQTSFTVDVYRVKTDAAAQVPVTTTVSESGIFTVPATVNFAAGESKTVMTVAIDFDKVQSGATYTLNFALDSAYTSIYGDDSCSYTVEYYEKGDPLRDLVAGYYEGTSAGYEYWSYAWYATAFSYDYNSGSVEALRIVPGDTKTSVTIHNLFPECDYLNVSDPVGEVVTSNEYEGYLGYIRIDPQKLGTYTTQGGYGTHDAYLGAAWASGSYASEPYDTIEAWIAGTGSVEDGTAVVTSVDFNGAGWVLMYGYEGWGMWYYAVCGGAVVTPVK